MVTADIHECKKIRSSLAKEESNLSLSNWESAIMEKSTAYYEGRINSRMKDLFEEFNLKTSSRREKVVSIDIEGRSDDYYSSVVFQLDAEATVSGDWKGYVSAKEIMIEKIGDTGWEFYDEYYDNEFNYHFSDEETAYQAIEKAVRTSPPIPLNRSKANVTDSQTMEATYRELDGIFGGEIRMTLHRGEACDSLRFEHPRFGACELSFYRDRVDWAFEGGEPELLFLEEDSNYDEVLADTFGEPDLTWMKP